MDFPLTTISIEKVTKTNKYEQRKRKNGLKRAKYVEDGKLVLEEEPKRRT